MKKLSKKEMKQVVGGVADCSCTCSNGSGSWTYNNGAQPGIEAVSRDFDEYCSTGAGTCTNCTNLHP